VEFLTVREFRASSKKIWARLGEEGKMVITNNGKPTALLLDIQNEDLEKFLFLLRRLAALRFLQDIQSETQKRGFLSDREIAAEIQAARANLPKTAKKNRRKI
jgi:hypothetical protein